MRILATALTLCLVSLVSPASGQTTFTDGTFLDSDWTTTVVSYNYSTLAGSTEHVATDGNPGDHRAITTYTGTANPRRVAVISMRNGAIYDPSVEGEILSLSYGEDYKCASADGCVGGGQAWWPVIHQDGEFYFYVHGLATGVVESWTTGMHAGMVASDFGELDVGESSWYNAALNPDFSISGGPIQFGYARGNSISSTRTGRIDNWTFDVETAPTVPQKTIDDIQQYDPITSNPNSPYLLETVTVGGIVTAQAGTYEENVLYIQDDTGGIMVYQSTPFDHRVGDYIAVRAVVDHNAGASSEVRLNTTYWAPLGDAVVPGPVDLTTTEVVSDPENIGSLVRVSGYVSELNSSDFMISNGADSVRVYVSPNSGISMAEVALADTFTVVGPLSRSNSEVRILPRDQYDLVEGLLQNDLRLVSYSCSNWAPRVNESWTMSFVVESSTPPEQLVFRYRYVEAGPEWTTLTWTPTAKSATGVYPTEFTGSSYGTPSEVEWDFDDGATNTTTMTPICNFVVGTSNVSEIHNLDICNPDQASPLLGKPVNLECIVVAAEPNRAILMDVESAPKKGVYPTEFTGSSYGTPAEVEWDFDDGATNTTTMTPCVSGDVVRLGGRVEELYGVTTIIPITYNSCYIVSFGNDLPVAERVPTGTLADNLNDGDCAQGEAFENVWVRPLNSVVMETSEFLSSGTYKVSSTGLLADAMTVRHSRPLNFEPALGQILDLTGYMTFRDDKYQLVIGSDDYVTVAGIAEIPDGGVPESVQGFVDIYPNPFNPQTKISFNVAKDNLTQLNIYNLRGELVKQLVNERLQGGQEYSRTWDGTDQQGRRQASGTYFARLRIGLEVIQVQKLAMLK